MPKKCKYASEPAEPLDEHETNGFLLTKLIFFILKLKGNAYMLLAKIPDHKNVVRSIFICRYCTYENHQTHKIPIRAAKQNAIRLILAEGKSQPPLEKSFQSKATAAQHRSKLKKRASIGLRNRSKCVVKYVIGAIFETLNIFKRTPRNVQANQGNDQENWYPTPELVGPQAADLFTSNDTSKTEFVELDHSIYEVSLSDGDVARCELIEPSNSILVYDNDGDLPTINSNDDLSEKNPTPQINFIESEFSCGDISPTDSNKTPCELYNRKSKKHRVNCLPSVQSNDIYGKESVNVPTKLFPPIESILSKITQREFSISDILGTESNRTQCDCCLCDFSKKSKSLSVPYCCQQSKYLRKCERNAAVTQYKRRTVLCNSCRLSLNDRVTKKRNGQFKCYHLDCAQEYKSKVSVGYHIMDHIQLKNYACEVCSRQFKRLPELKKHERKHLQASKSPLKVQFSNSRMYYHY